MRRLRMAMCACVAATLVNCQQTAENRANGDLVVTSVDPATAIEARYREGEHSLVLRSRPSGPAFKTEIIDEHGHDLGQLASAILERSPVRTPQGELTIPINGLFENASKLRSALQLSRHGLRQLRDTISTDAAESPAFRQLSQQTAVLRRALTQTRLALLQEWGNEAARHITMTPDERAKFFDILHRQALTIAAAPTTRSRAPAAATASSPDDDLSALLGRERYAQYQVRRTAWHAPIGQRELEVAP